MSASAKPVLHYLPLEGYTSRYSELMSCKDGWSEKNLSQYFSVNRIEPADAQSVTVIQNGSVLDKLNRPLWALEQVKRVLAETSGGRLFFEDMFHPGIEALFYTGRKYDLSTYCWAQSFDQHDFTREMVGWMRPYEMMLLSGGVRCFVASPLLQDLILTAVPGILPSQVPVVGLPFDSNMVEKVFDPAFADGEAFDVVYSSRFDIEKNPGFFLDIVEQLADSVRFVVCTGHSELRGNDTPSVRRALKLEDEGKLTIYKGLRKPEYYAILRKSTVQFNCASQDWVSFTLLEALTHGCLPVYPLYRDFATVFARFREATYAPLELDDAIERIVGALKLTNDTAVHAKYLSDLRAGILSYHDTAYERMARHML